MSSLKGTSFFAALPNTACQEPEQWGLEMFDEEGVEQSDEVDFN